MRFYENIRNLRKEKNLSQEYFAEKLGVTRQTISKWENGVAMPDLKKLTEIADFFGVSMDTLLGIEPDDKADRNSGFADNSKSHGSSATSHSNNNENNYNTEYLKQYTNQLFSISYQNQQIQNTANHRALKTTAIILGIAIACLIFGLILLFNSAESRINNLQNQINMLNMQNTANYDDFYEENAVFTYKFISADSENPYRINTRFTYSPDSYPKNAVVYINIGNSDGTSQRIDLQEENGLFTATEAIDVTLVENGYAYIDDGDVITREQIIYDKIFSDRFLALDSTFSFDYSSDSDKITYITELSEINISAYLESFEITEACIIAEQNSTEVYNEPVKFREDTAWQDDDFSDAKHYLFNIPSFSTKGIETSNVYLKITDSNGVIYKFYADLCDNYGNAGNNEKITNASEDTYKTEIIFAENKILH